MEPQDTGAIGKQIEDGVRLMGRGAEHIQWPIHLEVGLIIWSCPQCLLIFFTRQGHAQGNCFHSTLLMCGQLLQLSNKNMWFNMDIKWLILLIRTYFPSPKEIFISASCPMLIYTTKVRGYIYILSDLASWLSSFYLMGIWPVLKYSPRNLWNWGISTFCYPFTTQCLRFLCPWSAKCLWHSWLVSFNQSSINSDAMIHNHAKCLAMHY